MKIKYTQDRKKDSVIPIRSKDGSEMEIVFIFKFNQPNQPIIFYNKQFKFIVSFYAYDKIGLSIPFFATVISPRIATVRSKRFSLDNGTESVQNEFLATAHY